MNHEMNSNLMSKLIPNKLCIFNLDARVSNDEIMWLCRKHGEITSYFRTPDMKTAFVQYKTKNEAENAMPTLRDAGFSVNVAYDRKRNFQYDESGNPDRGINPKKIYLSNLPIQMRGRDIYSTCSRYGQIDYFHRTVCKTGLYCSYFNESVAKNALAKLRGEGFEVSYATDKLYSNQPREKKNNQVTECKIACTRCGKSATLKCSVCGDPYCSKQCQDEDWSSHRKNCTPVPDLAPIVAETEPTVNKRIRLNFDAEQNAQSEKYEAKQPIPKIHISSVSGAWKAENVITETPQKQRDVKAVDHYPMSKTKRGICHICNELTREHCQLCELPLCIRQASNCFHKFHSNIDADQNLHFAYQNENKSSGKCKNCNQSKARFHCMKCFNETSGKRAYFCFTNTRNCFQEFHSRDKLTGKSG